MKIRYFMKVSGSGNDFIIVDNRDGLLRPSPEYIRRLCSPKTGIGADGLILLEKSIKGFNFKMKYYNNDGYEANMCGNGGRSVVLFSHLMGITKNKKIIFESKKGLHEAKIKNKNVVKLQLSKPHSFKENITVETSYGKFNGYFVDTGVPHFIIETKNLDRIDVKTIGREIRFSKIFKPEGTNVDFVNYDKNLLKIRTYERGVEDETLSCGTGSVASALIIAKKYNKKSPITVLVKSGEKLKVYFDKDYEKVFLEGKVTPVFLGYNLL